MSEDRLYRMLELSADAIAAAEAQARQEPPPCYYVIGNCENCELATGAGRCRFSPIVDAPHGELQAIVDTAEMDGEYYNQAE